MDTMPMDVEPRAPEYLTQHGLGIPIEEGVSKHHTCAVLSDSFPSILPIASPSGICEQVPSTPLGNFSKEPAELVKQMYGSSPSIPAQSTVLDTVHGSCVLDVRDCDVLRSVGFSDVAMHYFTLLGDGVIPPGFFREFIGREGFIQRSSERSISLAAAISDAEAVRLLAIEKKNALYHPLGGSAGGSLAGFGPIGKDLAARVRLRGLMQNQPNEVDGSI